jgi:hypothetical protein
MLTLSALVLVFQNRRNDILNDTRLTGQHWRLGSFSRLTNHAMANPAR